MALPPPITLTEAAVARIKALMARADKPVAGLRVGVSTKGCSGLSYKIDYAEDGPRPFEEVVSQDGATVFLESNAVMFLIGSQMDFKQDKLSATFSFANPNEKARCGCGESFSV
ncbi:HesB/IscA family protein [Rhodospirillum rubrum]|uniref:HesB/YadR/YfhF n=1 Tax=Rhodospirillum rubrum (strain ATCC 11170 / ATH 1.1.1 / DSM 467 / LMG 4362 / NCIMB 8255 / S1) TaxID=269796 RepID=Q2RR80_RHORT|nr:iron-sulfur cluster assembly accessory protein [Rhodospirillum rubrum]ABC23365.1 HesB/YadR/YfhF [Rhodospirillum rubrum ATCC 11170]AEO49100.1 HesB/YadR/YfhF [Rhodospirillum rubrum F11]MBK1665761.1 iron-sulfur cluster assembly accessory protein [Rhodospirillum rubrum]MBK1677844.1 iron-sulfur cluster assembly accessory protein [Rhodospirillum rubrum]MBK5955010.1 iron-sulfur cluster assembly accessory protein [Rhodospirillum rubrum]